MSELREITAADRNVLHKVDSSGIRFRVKVPLPGLGSAITFTARHNPQLELYRIIIGPLTKLVPLTASETELSEYSLHHIDFREFQEFRITWYNKTIKISICDEKKPFLVYPMSTEFEIAHIQFNSMGRIWDPVEWIIETSPVILKTLPSKMFQSSRLYWAAMDNGKLPADAMIGGYENEPLYIARAYHNNSLMPGKYVPSKQLAYVAWGTTDHAKSDFEILCGHNALWVKTQFSYIPINAFVGGIAEMQSEPLYVGRAMFDGHLITGKVHVRCKSLFIPYKGKVVELKQFEILIAPQDDVLQAMPFVFNKQQSFISRYLQ